MKHPSNLNSRDMALLVPEFREKVEAVLKAVSSRGFKLVPYCTLIGPAREAALFCESRTWAEVQPIAARMRSQGAAMLADELTPTICWSGVGKRPAWKSNALPGQSSHVWGEAVDCYVQDRAGKASWAATNPGYRIYAEEAQKAGLTSGYFWQVKDAVHIQLRPVHEGPMFGRWGDIERVLMERFEL